MCGEYKMADVIKVLEKIKEIIENYQIDLSYSTYRSEEELVNELDLYIFKLKANDFSCNKEISLLFAPTGDLQEIAIDSGWSEEYMELAEIIDKYIK